MRRRRLPWVCVWRAVWRGIYWSKEIKHSCLCCKGKAYSMVRCWVSINPWSWFNSYNSMSWSVVVLLYHSSLPMTFIKHVVGNVVVQLVPIITWIIAAINSRLTSLLCFFPLEKWYSGIHLWDPLQTELLSEMLLLKMLQNLGSAVDLLNANGGIIHLLLLYMIVLYKEIKQTFHIKCSNWWSFCCTLKMLY